MTPDRVDGGLRALCGVFRDDGRRVDPGRLGAMAVAAPIPRPGPPRTWTEDGVGLAWLGGPERPAGDDTAIALLDGTLHDRAALLGALDLDPDEGAALPDAALALRAWRRWGERAVERLVGEYAFVVLERRGPRLVLARDAFGARPLVVHRRKGLVVFGTWIHSVLACPDVPRRIHEARVADSFVDALEALDATSTFYEGIERHPPSHVLVANREGQRLTRIEVLRPEDVTVPAGHDAQVAGLRDVLSAAVADRLDAAPEAGVLLSGGVDSIAVACLGRAHRAAHGGAAVPTFTGVLAEAEGGSDTEGPYARAVAAGGGLVPTWISPEAVGGCASALRTVIDRTEDLFDVSMLELRTVLYAQAAQQDVPMLLDGVDGNLVLSHDAEALGWLVRAGRLGEAWRVAGGLGRFYAASRLGLFWTYGLRSLRPERLARWKRRLVPSDPADRILRDVLVSPELARRVDLAGRVRRRVRHDAETEAALRADPAAHHRVNLESPLIPAALERYARAAAYQGLTASHPFLDRRVASYALALPFEAKVSGGTPKGILREALEGLAPHEVLWRPRAPNLSTAFWRATLEALDDLLADLEAGRFRDVAQFADLGEADKALAGWRQQGSVVSGVRALRVAALGYWLRRGA